MEEDLYRETYHNINPCRCVFEKSITSGRCQCSRAHRFRLADREGVSCIIELAQQRCQSLLQSLRENAIFAMRLTQIDGPLPHAKEIRVHAGSTADARSPE